MPSPSAATDPESVRLDSWKQIAAYLDKSERTVRRWQQTEGLPVHKHQHQARGSVWAYQHELDEWLGARRVSPEPLVEAQEPPLRRLWPMVVAIGALAAAAWLFLPRPAIPPAIVDPEPLTALPGAAYGPSFSPDGRQVAFFWTGGTSPSGIYRKVVGAEAVTPLVTSPGSSSYIYSPSWSPDGKTVAYLERLFPGSSFAPHNSRSETWLCLVDAAGGPSRRVIRLASGVLFYGNHSHLGWSYDSRRVLAPMSDGPRRGIHWIPVGGGAPGRITNPPAGHHHAPALSPDGRAIVYIRQTGPDQAALEYVYRQNLTPQGEPLGDPLLLSESRSFTSGLAWTPSGKGLIVCRAHSALMGPFDSRLFRLPAGSPGSPVALGLGQCNTVTVSSRDAGAMLAYGSGDHTKARLWQASVDAVEAAQPFAPSSRFDALPAFSPDGAFVSFVSNRSGRPEVWLARRDGADPRKLTAGSYVSSSPQWSPDGGRLAFGTARPAGSGGKASGHALYVLPVAGGDPLRVPLGAQPASDPAWTADGTRLQYWSGDEVWRVNPDGTSPLKLGEFPAHFVKSSAPAGPNLFYARSSAPFEIWSAPLEGPAPERVFAEGLAAPAFAVSGKSVYFVKAADQALYAKPREGGADRRLGKIEGLAGRLMLGIAVSPDERNLIWAITDEQRLDLLLVRDFR